MSFIPLDGAGNMRDVGGLPARCGTVRRGRLLRSGRLSGLTDEDQRRLSAIGLRHIFDLREKQERARHPTSWDEPAVTVWHDRDHIAPWSERLESYPADAAGIRSFMIDLYADLPTAFAPRIAEMARQIGAGTLPCLIHCSAGKDRTGVVVAVLLRLVGVSEDDVMKEYLRLDRRIGLVADQRAAFAAADGASPYLRLPDDALAIMLSTDRAFLDAAFQAIGASHGSFERYADEGLRLTRDERVALHAALVG